MNTQPNAVPGATFESQTSPPATVSPTRPMFQSLRRELWENRSIYIAPLVVSAVYLLGYSISIGSLPRTMRELPSFGPARQAVTLATPYSHAAMLLMVTGLIIGIFYSLDALHSERRDRSILFWKSLPVSDLTTVLSKASIPLIVLPTLVFCLSVIVQVLMRLLSLAVVSAGGVGASALWTGLPLFQIELVLLYGLAVITLWHAPFYCWFLLVSGWARRATFLWAVLPPLALGVFETIAFRTSYFGSIMHDRLSGFAAAAFDLTDSSGAPVDPHFIPLAQLAPGRFLSTPSLWMGLIVAAIFLAAAIRLRRYQGPI